MMSRRSLFLFVAALFLAPCSRVFAASEHPNILFICTDDQARWAVGANGNKEVVTPNMDRIYREGANFTNAFTTTPVCSPSRVGMLTGLHGIQANITDWIEPKDHVHGINPDYITWPEVLQKAGYVTGLIGKWHLGNEPQFHPTRNGLNHFMGMPGGGTNPFEPEFEVDGIARKISNVYSADFCGDDALHFIRQNKDLPFLLMLHFREPHTPYAPVSPEATSLYDKLDPTIPDFPGIDRERCKKVTKEYYSAISAADRNIGRVLALLDELRLSENTIVVFTSDHGYMIGHHGLWHKGNATTFPSAPPNFDEKTWKDPQRRRPNMFDDSIRIPLAIRWPGHIKPGTVIDQWVLQIDFYPTLLALAGVAMPKLPEIQPIEARDFSPFLLGRNPAWRDRYFGEYDMTDGKTSRMRMIRTADWKLIKHYAEAGGEDELYDLRKDPGETTNLFAHPPDAKILSGLEGELHDWQVGIKDPLVMDAGAKSK